MGIENGWRNFFPSELICNSTEHAILGDLARTHCEQEGSSRFQNERGFATGGSTTTGSTTTGDMNIVFIIYVNLFLLLLDIVIYLSSILICPTNRAERKTLLELEESLNVQPLSDSKRKAVKRALESSDKVFVEKGALGSASKHHPAAAAMDIIRAVLDKK